MLVNTGVGRVRRTPNPRSLGLPTFYTLDLTGVNPHIEPMRRLPLSGVRLSRDEDVH